MSQQEQPKVYPYLGRFITEDENKVYVVLFTDEEEGTVVLSNNPDVKFGTHRTFDESLFDVLEKEYVIRLSN